MDNIVTVEQVREAFDEAACVGCCSECHECKKNDLIEAVIVILENQALINSIDLISLKRELEGEMLYARV